MKKVIKTYYANLANMGDLLNELLIRNVFGQDLVRHKPSTSELSCIGSGMDCFMVKNKVYPQWYSLALQARSKFINYPNIVWCTGFLFHEMNDTRFFRKIEFRSVRGELTKTRVEKIIGKKLNIPTGDGGILAPLLFKKAIPKKYTVGIIPHMNEYDNPAFHKLKENYSNSVIIDLKQDAMSVIELIAQCETILSSSLHGLVVADSFKIPSKWIKVTDLMKGDGFKYHDYYSAYGITNTPTNITTKNVAPTVNQIIDEYKIKSEQIEQKQKEIYDAFPF